LVAFVSNAVQCGTLESTHLWGHFWGHVGLAELRCPHIGLGSCFEADGHRYQEN
jgi:hypothetical protein